MKEIKCIFCDTESNNVVIEENGYKGKKCPKCGLIFISPRPSFDEILNLYGHDDAHISAQSHIFADFRNRLFARHHLRLIRSFIRSGTLLEIGAGAGYFLDEARKIGFNPHGLEFNPIQSNYIKNNLSIPCEESPVNTSIFQGTQFDVIYHCDVVSHFFDPISDFTNINKIMKDDSFLIFETGNLGEVNPIYYKYFQRFQYPDHLFFFSTSNLVNLLEKTGFDFIKVYRYSILPQLKAEKALSGVKKLIGKHVLGADKKQQYSPDDVEAVDINSVVNYQSSRTRSIINKNINNIYQYFSYVLRYKIGRIAPKSHRPQTIIIVARKRAQSYVSDNSQQKGCFA